MRVALYNQMFGLDGRSLMSNLMGYRAVHFKSDPMEVYGRANLEESVRTIRDSGADIVGICEIVGRQEEDLWKLLRKEGYEHIFFGEGHRTKCSGLIVKVAIASKEEFEEIVMPFDGEFPVENERGGGGGFVHGHSVRDGLDVLCTHFASPKKEELRRMQFEFLNDYMGIIDGKAILLGDFNVDYKNLKSCFEEFPNLEGFKLASDRIKTCSETPFFKTVIHKDYDHILVRDLETIGCGSLKGRSDHKLVYVDLK